MFPAVSGAFFAKKRFFSVFCEGDCGRATIQTPIYQYIVLTVSSGEPGLFKILGFDDARAYRLLWQKRRDFGAGLDKRTRYNL